MSSPPLILVVDDSPTQQMQMRLLLESAGYRVTLASDGLDAMDAIARELPDLVVTDLQMPNMNGLELVAQIKTHFPSVPVILATAVGSETIAAAALHKGASSYVPKSDLVTSLTPIVEQVLRNASASQSIRDIQSSFQSIQLRMRINNDETLVPSMIARFEQAACELDFCDKMLWMQIAMALDEGLINAIFHGNLEVSSELRQLDDGKPFVDLVQHRKSISPYCDRTVDVIMHAEREQIEFVITDQGPGFEVAALPDPTDLANLERAGGRGLLLIHSFMDEVHHNDQGNQITMVKYKPTGEETDEEE